MGKRISKEILLTNPNASELEHIFSYSQNRHIFNLTIMCIKYRVDFMNGAILKIEYHGDYKNCFHPLMGADNISEVIINIAESIIKYYLEENSWLKGWEKDWSKNSKKIWDSKMKLDPSNFLYSYSNNEDAWVCYLSKSIQDTSLLCKVL